MLKLANLCLIAVFAVLFLSTSYAQKGTQKKIVVVEKTTHENGNVVTRRVEKTGTDAEAYLKEKKEELGIDIELDSFSRSFEKEVTIDVSQAEVREERKVKIITKNDAGEQVVLEWNGEGEMPPEIKKYMDQHEVEVEVESEIEEIMTKVDSGRQKYLGIRVNNHVDGVEILDVYDDSPAKAAALQKGDVIYQLGEESIGSSLQLEDRLRKLGRDTETKIHYIRVGQKETVKIQL